MTMNAELAAFYGTNGATEEDQEKLASVQNFAKLAAKHGVDLTQMEDAEVDALYAEVYPEFAKTAADNGFPPKKKDEDEDEEEDEKKEAAAQYHQEKLAFQEKVAEADFMGRVMAHSFTQEMGNIEKGAADYSVMKTTTGKLLRRALKKGPTGTQARALLKGKAEKAGKAGMEHVKKHKGKYMAGGAAAGTGAGFAAGRKTASAAQFEELAANHAIKVAEAGGYDVDQAHELVSSVYNLGLEETEKVAGVQDLDDAIHVRGLEYLEAAGYDVNWDEVFGG
jgi:hypothetical protein